MGNSEPQLLRKVISLCKRRGFFFRAPLSQHGREEERYAFGPLGAELKRNLINEWWYSVVTSNEFVYALNTPSFTNNQEKSLESTTLPATSKHAEGDLKSRVSGGSYQLRKGALMHLSDCIKSMGLKVPFGLAETGNEFRRDCSSNPFILKSMEYDSFGLHFFGPPEEHRQWYSYWQKKRLQWWKKFANHTERFSLGEGEESQQREAVINNGDQYMYSTVQFEFPWGVYDLETLTKLGDSFFQEVSQEMTNSRESLLKIARVRGKTAFPFLISLSGDIDGALLAYLCDAYTEAVHVTTRELKAMPVLRLHRSLAPYKVAILPQDTTSDKLIKYCRKLTTELKSVGISTMCNFTGPLDERLQLHNEMGTPYRVVADVGLLESGVVKLQDRDTTVQEEMNGNDVLSTMVKFLRRELS